MSPDPVTIPEEESDVADDKSVIDKLEEATGGMHKGAPAAGEQQEGNFENTVIRGREAESM